MEKEKFTIKTETVDEKGRVLKEVPTFPGRWNHGLGEKGLDSAREHWSREMGSHKPGANMSPWVIEGYDKEGKIVYRENGFEKMPNLDNVSKDDKEEVSYAVVLYNIS